MLLTKIRGLLNRAPACDHAFGEWRFYRSRIGGWKKVRYCQICKACDRRSVVLTRAYHA